MCVAEAVAQPPPEINSPPPDEKLCVDCGKMLNSETGYVNSSSVRTGKQYLNSACRPCHNHRVQVVAKIEAKIRTSRGGHAVPVLRADL